jgi:putative salt-induced outer membrane protein
LLILFLPVVAASAQAIRLQLRNGDRLSGVLVSETSADITLSNAMLGRFAVPLAQVEHREPMATLPATPTPTHADSGRVAPQTVDPATTKRLNDLLASYVTGRLSSEEYHRQRARLLAEPAAGPGGVARGEPQRQGSAGGVKPAAAASQAAATKKPAVPKHLSGEAPMGTDLGFSQKERQLYTGRLRLSYTRAPVRNAFDYLFTYGKTDGEVSANRMDSSMKTDYDVNPDAYVYSLEGGGYDQIRKIDWRSEVGPGFGYHLVKRTNFVLRAESGFHYEIHNFEDNKQAELYYHRLAQELRWNVGTLVSLDEKLEYLPQVDTLREYKLRVESNLRLWLRSNLYLNLADNDTYDTLTAPGVGQNDLQVRSSVGLRF